MALSHPSTLFRGHKVIPDEPDKLLEMLLKTRNGIMNLDDTNNNNDEFFYINNFDTRCM